jgi:PAS domain S-box-containing protein
VLPLEPLDYYAPRFSLLARRLPPFLPALQRRALVDQAGAYHLFPNFMAETPAAGIPVLSALPLPDNLTQPAEAQYRTLSNSLDEGICLFELLYDEQGAAVDYRFVEVNPAFARQTGLTDAPGKLGSDVAPGPASYWLGTYAHVLKTGKPVRFEYHHQGTERWYEAYASRVGGEGSRQVYTVFNDITERKQDAQQQQFLLQLSDVLRPLADPRAIQQAALHFVAEQLGLDRLLYNEINPDLTTYTVRAIYVREGFSAYGGVQPLGPFTESVRALQQGVIKVVYDVETDESFSPAERAICAGIQVRAFVVVPLLKHGRWVLNLVAHSSQPRPWPPYELHLLAETAERTWAAVERAQAEAALHASEARLQLALSAANLGTFSWYVADDRTEADARALTHFGFPPDAAATLSESLARIFHPEDGPRYVAAIGRAIDPAGAGALHQEFRIRRPDGERWMAVTATTVFEGNPRVATHLTGVLADITARKQAEESLRQAAELDSFRVGLADALSPLTDSVAIQQAAMRIVGERLGVDRVLYGEIVGDDVTIADNYVRGDAPKSIGKFSTSTFGTARDIQLKGDNFITNDIATDERLPPAEREAMLELGYHSCLAVPLFKNGRWVAHFAAYRDRPHAWTASEIRLLTDASERTWTAVRRAVAEEAQRLSEQRLRIAVEAAQQGTWDWDLVTNEVRWNARHFALFGLEPHPEQPVTPADFERHVHPADRAEVLQRLQTAIAEHVLFEAEFRAVTAQGEERWMSGYGQATAIEPDGRTRRLSGVMLDITARKQVELQLQELAASLERKVARRTQALLQSRDLLQSVYDTTLVGMAVLRAVFNEQGAIVDFAFVSVNRKWQEETGRTDLVGKHYAQEFPGIEPSGLLALMRQAVETGQSQQTEYYYPYEGVAQWYSSMYIKLNSDGVVATTLNITARQQAEQERLRTLTLLQRAEAMAGLGSWSYELATGHLLFSDGMYQLLGLPKGSVAAPSIYVELVVAEDRDRAQQFVQQLLAGIADWEDTLRLRVGEQVKTVRRQTLVLRNAAGEAVRVLGVDQDISEVRRLEADNLQLRLAQQQALFEAVLDAQEIERKRIAESLHNGLGQILYATKLQLNQLPAGPSALARANQLLAEAIRQTRTLSHELVPTALTEFGLGPALQDITRSLSSPHLRIQSTGGLDEAQRLPQPLQVALYRIAQELLHNVVKHAHATHASLALELVPGFVLLRVEDNGVGFAQAAVAPAGLGLRTIRSRVALLNGQLEMNSSPAYGTYVRLRIPLPPLDPLPAAYSA